MTETTHQNHDYKMPYFRWDPAFATSVSLRSIAHKLNNADRVAKRLEAEGADIEPRAYLERLRKRRTELMEQAQDADRARRERAQAKRDETLQSVTLMQRAASTFSAEPALTGLPPNIAPKVGLTPFPPDARVSTLLRLLDGVSCGTLEGEASLQSTDFARSSDLNHNSTAGMSADETRRDDIGVVGLDTTLNDDASWWRNDDPDKFTAIYGMVWQLPMQKCDSVAVCEVFTDQRVEYTNEADDYSSCKTGIASTHTDPDGNFVEILLPNGNAKVFDGRESGVAESGTVSYWAAFTVKAGVRGIFAIAHYVSLAAQDGRVSALLRVRAGRELLGVSPPLMRYTMIPI